MNEVTKKKTVQSVLDSQREESEVRSLLHDLEKLISLKGEKKRRWVWELIQNALDCAAGNKINLYFKLTKNKLIFEHDGEPFQIEHLIALVRKTSTKSIEGLEGNTGKFGTGFVTTHVLNSKVNVSGLLQNDDGCRQFDLLIDRSFDTLSTLKDSLGKAYNEIEIINETPPITEIHEIKSRYEYELEDNKFSIAKDSLAELERNLSFTLLINSKLLSSVTIIDEEDKRKKYSINSSQIAFADIGFTSIQVEGSNHSEIETGLLFKQTDNLTIAFPVTKSGDYYFLNKIKDQARIFRNYPLIGTEKSHFPCFIHSGLFQPTEPRDGIRTLKDREDKPDKHADNNREALIQYVSLFQSTFSLFLENKIKNIHLLAESGTPEDFHNYLAKDWFEREIQKPLRDFLLKRDLVLTTDGSLIKIEAAKFIKSYDITLEDEFHSIVSELYPSNCPDKESYKDWKAIIEQDEEKWLDGIFVEIEDVVKEVERKVRIDDLKISGGASIQWLNKLIAYILKTGNIKLTEDYAIYPNQSKDFKKRLELKLDPGFDNEIKSTFKNIFRNLSDELILDEIENKDGIQKFEITQFFLKLNTYIGALDCSIATKEQVDAIFELGCYFKEAIAPKRNEWFELTNLLLPHLSKTKLSANILDEFNLDSTDKWTLKYVSMTIEKSKTFSTFSETFFSNTDKEAIDWLNKFLSFVCRNEESKDIAFKYAIVLTQDGIFKKNEKLICERNPKEFEDLFKDMIKDFLGKGDPREYLIDNRISNEFFTIEDAKYLTGQIDNLFGTDKIEREVEEGERFNPLFHKLNDWFGKNEENAKLLFPIFYGKRPILSVRAFGKEMSQIISDKGIDEIKKIAKLNRNFEELLLLERAAELAGSPHVLLTYAKEIHAEAERIRWRKEIGVSAEKAFQEAILEIDTKFDIENPDYGKDFTIISKSTGKEYYIEIKSTIIGEETVKMSSLQGLTAKEEKDHYALCVITRPSGTTIIEKEYFLQHVKFVPKIGELISEKLSNILNDLNSISVHETGEDINVTMDNKAYSINVKKKIWNDGISFNEFVTLLETYLNT